MQDVDYAALFGVTLETGEKGQEAAEPAGTEETEGGKEQEIAEPAGNDTGDEAGAGIEARPAEEEKPDAGAGKARNDENAAFAAARRKAERERDTAIARERERLQAEAAREMDAMVAGLGLTDPYTKETITTKAQYDAYRARVATDRKERLQKKAGLSDDELREFVDTLPEVAEAREKTAEADRVLKDARDSQAKAAIEAEITEIGKLDPAIKSMEDLTKLPNYGDFYRLVQEGKTFTEAYKLVNFDRLMEERGAAARQQARNQTAGKEHLRATGSRGTGGITVPEDQMREFRLWNPGASDEEIRAWYQKNHRQ